ncbi:MAG TPA: selenocysteine synthase [Pasteurellaceae bacterium]|nr:selenocysteine synthase [Pasteurellaceae bacterium]
MTKPVTIDPLYFSRISLAKALLDNLAQGISSAFTLFAPRRMGKTQFLLNDITPVAKELGFNLFYFSFMNENSQSVQNEFKIALSRFCDEIRPTTTLKTIKSIDLFGVSIERAVENQPDFSVSHLIDELAKDNKPTLMLLDEVQELARIKDADGLIRSLRTGLDINKNKVKVIFTGSSTNGLRAIFNDSKAPFFHFSHPINFPLLDKTFTDFLADIYQKRTGNKLNKNQFFNVFRTLNFTPLYLRAITQDMIIDPSLTLEAAANIRLQQMHEQSDYSQIWQELSELEKWILVSVHNGESGLYKTSVRRVLAEKLGVKEITASTMQTQLKKLQRRDLISKQSDNSWIINNVLFSSWLNAKITHNIE